MNVKSYIDQRGMTIAAAAADSGLSRPVLQRIVNGTRPASRQAMQKLVAWSGGQITYEDFFRDMPASVPDRGRAVLEHSRQRTPQCAEAALERAAANRSAA